MEDDAPDPDDLTPEQEALIEAELDRVFGNRLPGGFGPMLLPLASHETATR